MTVNVRFVPKGTSQVSFADLAMASLPQAADMVDPTKRNMDAGRDRLLERGIGSQATALNRLVTEMSEAQFQEMFETRLKNEPAKKVAKVKSLATVESYQRAVDGLKVPEALQDVIAFAYVPRPVEYFAPQPLPPHEDIYHLRLGDVALALNAPRCHQKGFNGTGSKVAMADSGFWLHPHFIRSGYSLIPTESPGSGAANIDASGHGTGESANIFAVAPRATVFGVKHGSSAAGTLEKCIDLKPHVMTNSWGWSIDRQTRNQLRTSDPGMYAEVVDLESVIRRAVGLNITVLFSAGNGHLSFPACLPEVIAVGGATWNEDGSVEASSYASAFASKLYPGRNVPNVCGLVGRSGTAPQSAHIMLPVPDTSELDGMNFRSGKKGTGWGIFSGTSAACPQVAGVVALIKQINPSLAPGQIRQVLEANAVDVVKGKTATNATARVGRDLATGAGLVDALRVCGFLEGS